MPRGQPDYGLYTQTPVASGISDPGEAAARLGSINIYDRRGWTVWMDDFEAPVLKWADASSVGGTDPVLSTNAAWMGVQSVYYTTAAVANEWASILRRFPLLRLGKTGIEFFIRPHISTPGYFRVRFRISDGTNRSDGELRLDNQARTATIRTPAGNIVVATNVFNNFPDNIWTPVKLVVDMDTDYYVRLLIGSQEIDLSAHALVAGGATAVSQLWVEMDLRGDAIGAMSAYIDNFILTQNEP